MSEDTTELFGFSAAPGTGAGPILPYIKYNSKAGIMWRIDRQPGAQGWETSEIDISHGFVAQFDFENAETGWMRFTPPHPDFRMVPILPKTRLPDQPKLADGITADGSYKHGLRFTVKLAPAVADGTARIRELASNAKAFVNGIAPVMRAYLAETNKYPGMLPIVKMTGKRAEKSGAPGREQTNFVPIFVIEGWAPRGDLKHVARAQGTVMTVPAANGSGAPATGAAPAQAPVNYQSSTEVQQRRVVPAPAYNPDDFG